MKKLTMALVTLTLSITCLTGCGDKDEITPYENTSTTTTTTSTVAEDVDTTTTAADTTSEDSDSEEPAETTVPDENSTETTTTATATVTVEGHVAGVDSVDTTDKQNTATPLSNNKTSSNDQTVNNTPKQTTAKVDNNNTVKTTTTTVKRETTKVTTAAPKVTTTPKVTTVKQTTAPKVTTVKTTTAPKVTTIKQTTAPKVTTAPKQTTKPVTTTTAPKQPTQPVESNKHVHNFVNSTVTETINHPAEYGTRTYWYYSPVYMEGKGNGLMDLNKIAPYRIQMKFWNAPNNMSLWGTDEYVMNDYDLFAYYYGEPDNIPKSDIREWIDDGSIDPTMYNPGHDDHVWYELLPDGWNWDHPYTFNKDLDILFITDWSAAVRLYNNYTNHAGLHDMDTDYDGEYVPVYQKTVLVKDAWTEEVSHTVKKCSCGAIG